MQRAEDEVVGRGDADLLGGFAEVPVIQVGHDGRWPAVPGHLLVEQLRRPAAPEQRAPADAVGKTREPLGHVGVPGQPPDLVARALVGRRRAGWVKPQHRQVLHVLIQDEGAGLQDRDPMAVGRVEGEQVVGDE